MKWSITVVESPTIAIRGGRGILSSESGMRTRYVEVEAQSEEAALGEVTALPGADIFIAPYESVHHWKVPAKPQPVQVPR